MALTRTEILKEIDGKRIKISPFDREAVGPASVDLTLDAELRAFICQEKPIPVTEDVDYKQYTRVVDITDGYLLKPGELVMGITRETITLPDDVCGWLQSRSRFARVGLMSHITAPFIAPGVSNRSVLEIFNAGPETLELNPGVRICHIILQRCEGEAHYEGRFKDQGLR
ncbi:MAG: dCTP deaminase [Nanobdellota archaeon]